MATGKITNVNMKFDYGNEVILRQTGPDGNVIDKLCVVVGITPVETDDQARIFGYPRGIVLYTVEFGDGSDKLVSEDALKSA